MLIRSLDILDVKPIEQHQYVPRGQTALLDAIGNTLTYFMNKKLLNNDAYDSCLIYIVTDGLENASKNFSAKKIKRIVTEAEDNYNIKIIYLAANQDAILEANKYGIDASQALNYSETADNVSSAYRSVANVACRVRSTGNASFTQVERTASQIN